EPPAVALTTQGYQYLTELRYDQLEPALETLRRGIVELGLPLRSLEVEFGPSQCEFTFEPAAGIDAADRMVLFRSAAKQIARRNGWHVTFMCRPRIPNVMSSGWHLHQSLRDASGANAFVPDAAGRSLSPLGEHYLGGLLAHARASAAFASPTINGFRRFRPNSLAPDRALWARDNRAAMLRVLGGAGDPATRIENRIGEPAANPYLYIGSQLIAGLAGIERRADPGPPADTPYDTPAPALPRSLHEALDCLAGDETMRAGFGGEFVDYFVHIKRAELARFEADVTDWEQREYFELF
ncbi:MAG TPA: glutamine synthetase family protein, partial [Burkholderiaceae bacterium]|nr:glutamine synthetase family protein [Burkholderiaceae bacterium]